MESSLDFSTYFHYNVIPKSHVDSERLDWMVRNFDVGGVAVRRVEGEELRAGFRKHNIDTTDLDSKSSSDYFFLVCPVPFTM